MATMLWGLLPAPGDRLARPFALAQRGFHWQPEAGAWVRGAVTVSEEALDTMGAQQWAAFLVHLDDPGCPTCGRAWG